MDYAGDTSYDPPVVINCRWNDMEQLIIDSEGRERVSKAMIHPEVEVPVESYIAFGDQSATVNPDTLDTSEVYEIIKIDNSKGVKQDSEMYTIWV
jgi:hypothetical protein